MRLGELGLVLGGDIREVGDRRWLDTQVGGLRACIIDREGRFDIAVFTADARALDPFSVTGPEWELAGPRLVPKLSAGFLFAGCRSGVLFASHSDPSVESTVLALTELVEWARMPWQPLEPGRAKSRARYRAWIRRERWVRLTRALLAPALVRWLRSGMSVEDASPPP